MKKTLLLPVLLILIGIMLGSCERINEEPTMEGLAELKDIPIEYGSLVSVTMTEQYPGWAQMWFQDDAGAVNMIRVQWLTGKMIGEPLTITRTRPVSEGE